MAETTLNDTAHALSARAQKLRALSSALTHIELEDVSREMEQNVIEARDALVRIAAGLDLLATAYTDSDGDGIPDDADLITTVGAAVSHLLDTPNHEESK
jgi:hypothetical protein